MRGGLTEPEPPAVHGTFQAAITGVSVLAVLALCASACGTGGTGARDEGPAHAEAVVGATPSPGGYSDPKDIDAVSLVKDDPAVSTEVKRELKPCVADQYPVDVEYGNLTGGAATDIVVNVLTCTDAVGVGSYVYHEKDGRYQNVFKAEEPPVYAEIDRGYLVVTKQVYAKDDPVSNPSGETVITYAWNASEFAKKYSTHTEYGNTGTEATPAPGGG
ncbi:hypothetical protein [Streptomyces acidiscabies]|uniref:Lipoprotein CseA n=1 Tax=Streptomyces acidiscabies TaxID=42234 RepID=A0AAP6BG70_9ACTN|nr:hypothetical protein [Streptomyces acidiscabies]MBP5937790.1 hypothetical protein [Streptomyces sp. LBUM 1476]MBZ3914097.1 hypothetical protein [Streptomyces acidiscabies]MDX2964169.1 hypothetical protein [Streptomyces acidiscabies]MDX3025775.1 hypothetical protein [Streptomyces acidiscabies]MDX3794163.1 hypothetical protein [Streptomyces acidiscabies]